MCAAFYPLFSQKRTKKKGKPVLGLILKFQNSESLFVPNRTTQDTCIASIRVRQYHSGQLLLSGWRDRARPRMGYELRSNFPQWQLAWKGQQAVGNISAVSWRWCKPTIRHLAKIGRGKLSFKHHPPRHTHCVPSEIVDGTTHVFSGIASSGGHCGGHRESVQVRLDDGGCWNSSWFTRCWWWYWLHNAFLRNESKMIVLAGSHQGQCESSAHD